MLTNVDLELFQKATGLEAPTKSFEDNAAELSRTLARMGRSGPLGCELMATLIQRAKLCPPPDFLHPAVTDWRLLDKRVRVAYTPKGGETVFGEFLGHNTWGMNILRLEGEDFDREVAPKYCKLAIEQPVDPKAKKAPAKA